MEIVAGIGGSIGAGLSTLGGSAATAGSIGQGMGSAFEALSMIGAGRSKKRQLKAQALASEIEAEETALRITREAVVGISQLKVAAAAAGVDPTVGTPEIHGQDALNELDTALTDIRYRGALAATSYRAQGKAAVTQSWMQAAGTMSQAAQSIAKRGGPTVATGGITLPSRNPSRS